MAIARVGAGTVSAFGETVRGAFGKGGAVLAVDKREGDGATPLGDWAVRGALLRPDRVAAPVTLLPWRWLRRWDGWSDGVGDPVYNRAVVLPHGYSAENLWREDGAYDVIIVLGHNDSPPVQGLGSAIFWHVAQPDWRGTEGCVAVERGVLLRWLGRMRVGDLVRMV